MQIASSYVHALEGRLRIKILVARGDARTAREIETRLRQTVQVDEVAANPITGNVLIFYNPRLIKQEEIFFVLQELGYLPAPIQYGRAATTSQGLMERLTTTVAAAIMEVALGQIVSALI